MDCLAVLLGGIDVECESPDATQSVMVAAAGPLLLWLPIKAFGGIQFRLCFWACHELNLFTTG